MRCIFAARRGQAPKICRGAANRLQLQREDGGLTDKMIQQIFTACRARCVCMVLANLSLLLAACSSGGTLAGGGSASGTVPAGLLLAGEAVRAPPRQAVDGECWGDETTPAVIETITDQREVTPAVVGGDGAVLTPATFQTQTRQSIVSERQDIWFRVPCPAQMVAGSIETLQRALKVRGFYRGGITGEMDGATEEAVRKYQAAQGLDSNRLSLRAAQQLGLVAFDREKLK